MNQKIRLTAIVIILLLTFNSNLILAESDENTLYVTVFGQAVDPARELYDATVRLELGAITGERSIIGNANTSSGQAVFYNLSPDVYTITVSAPGYISASKEFTKQAGAAAHLQIALAAAPQGATGSVRVVVLMQVPQTPTALTKATIDIFKARKLVARADTKNTRGKEGKVFSDLPIGEDYEAYVTARGFIPHRESFIIESNQETWLPIEPDIVRERTICTEECVCDSESNIIYCTGTGVGEIGVLITAEEAAQKATEELGIRSVEKIEPEKIINNIFYEVTGVMEKRLLFIIPVSFQARVAVNAQTGDIEKVEKPWWSFLAW